MLLDYITFTSFSSSKVILSTLVQVILPCSQYTTFTIPQNHPILNIQLSYLYTIMNIKWG